MRNVRLTNCAVCGCELKQQAEYDMERGTYTYNCPCCGQYKCTEETDDVLPRMPFADRVRLSSAVREQVDRASRDRSIDFPLLRSDNIALYLANAPASYDVAAKVRKLLLAIVRRTTLPGEMIDFADTTSYTLAYAGNFDEGEYLTDYAVNQGWIEKDRRDRSGNQQMRLTPAGWEESQRRPRIESAQGFVAMCSIQK